MTRSRNRRIRIALVLACALCSLPGLSIVARALQSGEIFSPVSGHAQVIAQGVATMPNEAAWRVVFHSIDPRGAAELSAGGPGFILVDTGGVVVTEGERSDLLEPGESTTVIGNESPVLVLVTLGAVRAEATDGSSASLKVGEAATFSGDVVLTADGQVPSTVIAAVIGREAPVAAGAATPGATPIPATVGSVQ